VLKLGRPFVYPSQHGRDFYTMARCDAFGFKGEGRTGYEGNADTSLA